MTISLAGLALAGVTYAALETSPSRSAVAGLAEAIWLCSLLWGHLVTARDISAGMAPGRTAQDPVMMGWLITTGRVAARGSPAPEFGDAAFKTGGFLLSRRNGAAYFVPGTYAQEVIDGYGGSGLSVVPEQQVITFIYDQGS